MTLCCKWLARFPLTKHFETLLTQKPPFIAYISRYEGYHQHLVQYRLHSNLYPCIIYNGHETRSHFPILRKHDSFGSSPQFSESVTRNSWANFSIKHYCSHPPVPEKKPSLIQRFKQMYKEYWYVLVPVHLVTSAVWFGSFYYLAESGVDIASCLEYIGAGERLVTKLRSGNSPLGYLAIAYALYKIATPARYTVTLGGTTISIKYLRDWGYIKPIPPRDKLKEMIHEKKDIFLEKKEQLKNRYKEKGFIDRLLTKLRLKKNKDETE